MRILAKVSYKGTCYQGWQKQINAPTIQEEIEKVLSKILNTPISIFGSGRTDAGVHAVNQTFHFDINKSVDLDKLKTQVSKTYIVSDKIRDKYIKKAEKKEKETIYNNYNLGIEILNYIYGNSNFNYLGERYGIENHVLDKLADLDSADSKLIIIVNLDALGVEVFYSVPYNLLQKGTAGLESELIYRSRINEFVLQEYLDAIIK